MLGLSNSVTKFLVSIFHALAWISSIIVMGITAYYIRNYPNDMHLVYELVIVSPFRLASFIPLSKGILTLTTYPGNHLRSILAPLLHPSLPRLLQTVVPPRQLHLLIPVSRPNSTKLHKRPSPLSSPHSFPFPHFPPQSHPPKIPKLTLPPLSWLTSFIFAAEDYNRGNCYYNAPRFGRCSLKWANQAFIFLAFIFTVFAMVADAMSKGDEDNASAAYEKNVRHSAETGATGATAA